MAEAADLLHTTIWAGGLPLDMLPEAKREEWVAQAQHMPLMLHGQ